MALQASFNTGTFRPRVSRHNEVRILYFGLQIACLSSIPTLHASGESRSSKIL